MSRSRHNAFPANVDDHRTSCGNEYGEVVMLKAGQRIKTIYLIKYLGSENSQEASVEALEVLLEDAPPVLLVADTDWTLKATPGQWPTLPTWCWPTNDWVFDELPGLCPSGVAISSVSEVLNVMNEVCGLVVGLEKGTLEVSSGETLGWQLWC